MSNKWIVLLMIPISFILMGVSGCSENYRYPCQDPENWEQKQCKKPFCSANGTCPEDLTHYEKKNLNDTQPDSKKTIINDKGACK